MSVNKTYVMHMFLTVRKSSGKVKRSTIDISRNLGSKSDICTGHADGRVYMWPPCEIAANNKKSLFEKKF